MKFQCNGLLLLCGVSLCAGHAGLLQQRTGSDAGFKNRLAGVRQCLNLHGGDEMEVLAMKQRYGAKNSFLVARPAGSPKLVAKAALHATYEALFRGAGCHDADDQSTAKWFVDVGTDDDELLALASSLGCGVSVLDPEVKDVRAVDMTRCMNEEPNRPFVVFQVTASNITNPETLANMTNATRAAESAPIDTSNASAAPHTKSLLGQMLKVWPKMLNVRKKKKEAEVAQHEQNTEGEEKEESQEEAAPAEAAANVTAPVVLAEPLEPGVSLDTIFAKSGSENAASEVTTPTGSTVMVNQIALLKVTPRSESVAALKALQGAHELLTSGRVQCMTTEMNFDMNHTESLLNYFAELERVGFQFAHMGSMDYSELEISDKGQYEVFKTDAKQLGELFDTYKRIRSFDERSGFRVYSGSLSLDRKGHYFDYTDVIFACRGSFPEELSLLEKGNIRFRNGVWWLEKATASN